VKRSATVLLLAPLAAGCSDGAPPEPTHYASHQECEATTKDGRGCHRSSGGGAAAASWNYIKSYHVPSAPGYTPTSALRSRPRQAISQARANFSRSGIPNTGTRGGFGATGRSLSVPS
jgi:hypothetical protein